MTTKSLELTCVLSCVRQVQKILGVQRNKWHEDWWSNIQDDLDKRSKSARKVKRPDIPVRRNVSAGEAPDRRSDSPASKKWWALDQLHQLICNT